MVDEANNSPTSKHAGDSSGLIVREPNSFDGMPVYKLIQNSPPLDTNSVYCNLLQCTQFASTCVVVELDGELAGFMSAFVKPSEPDVLFVWQMVVTSATRGRGVAGRMLEHLLEREHLADIRFIETTISPGNAPSEAVFLRFAKANDAAVSKNILFSKEGHFDGQHDDEVLYRIGPFTFSKTS